MFKTHRLVWFAGPEKPVEFNDESIKGSTTPQAAADKAADAWAKDAATPRSAEEETMYGSTNDPLSGMKAAQRQDKNDEINDQLAKFQEATEKVYAEKTVLPSVDGPNSATRKVVGDHPDGGDRRLASN